MAHCRRSAVPRLSNKDQKLKIRLMDTQERIRKIEDFIHLQRYLHGLHFHIIADKELEDAFIIEFATATDRQITSLNHALRTRMMSHIRCRAIKIIDQPKNQKPWQKK